MAKLSTGFIIKDRCDYQNKGENRYSALVHRGIIMEQCLRTLITHINVSRQHRQERGMRRFNRVKFSLWTHHTFWSLLMGERLVTV